MKIVMTTMVRKVTIMIKSKMANIPARGSR